MELRTVRPVLSAGDLTFIIDGLNEVFSEFSDTAVELAKAEEFEQAGETLALGNEVALLTLRMESLHAAIVREMIEASVERDNEVANTTDPDGIDTIPLSEVIEGNKGYDDTVLTPSPTVVAPLDIGSDET